MSIRSSSFSINLCINHEELIKIIKGGIAKYLIERKRGWVKWWFRGGFVRKSSS